MTEESEQIAAEDDVATQYLWRSVRAKLLARQGRFAEAEALAERGDRHHRDGPGPRLAGLRGDRPGRGLRLAGRRAAAMPRRPRRPAARSTCKANLASAGRARRLRDEIDAGLAVGG